MATRPFLNGQAFILEGLDWQSSSPADGNGLRCSTGTC